MKKVLQVLGSLQRGGAETMVMNLYRNLDKNEYQFDFLLKDHCDDGYEDEVRKMGGNIYYVPSAKKVGLIKNILLQRNVMKKMGPYIAVHSHMNIISGFTMLSAFMARIPIRITHSHNTIFKHSKPVIIAAKALINLFSTRKLACGVDAGKAMFDDKRFIVIPNAIDIKKYILETKDEKSDAKIKMKFSSSALNICHIGRFADVKNHYFILEVAKELKKQKFNFRIHLLGDGELLEDVKEKIKDFKLEEIVILHGSVPNPNDYIKASDLFILPSKFEGLPVSLIEAQCAGIKCFVSDKVTREVDFDLNLITFLPLVKELWVDAIKEQHIVNDVECAENIKSKLENRGYTVEGSIKKLLRIYEGKL